MGGPMDVWDVEEYPWLIVEKTAIRTWVREMQKPYLGLCLGHQLLADALGGTCGPQDPAEIGIFNVELTEEGRADPLFSGMSTVQKCLQWHSVRVAQPPQGSIILATSPACPVQAMRIGTNAWSMQYHVEIEPDTIANWSEIPAYRKALIDILGDTGYDAMSAEADQHMGDFMASSEKLYQNFMRMAR